MGNYNLGEARGKIVLETDFSSLKEGQRTLDDVKASADSAAQTQQQAWGKVGTAATVGGATVVAGFAAAVASASSFEFKMSAIQAVSGATAAEMETISDAALRIGQETSFSASEAALAMEELMKAGLSVDDVLNGAADATVALAAAGQIELPEAATIASNALNQFKLGAEDLTDVADLMAGAANASATGVSEIGMALSFAGPTAHAAGVSIGDAAQMIALFANNGIDGARAGTALRGLIGSLASPTKEATNILRELGLVTFDTGKMYQYLSEQGFQPASQDMGDLASAAGNMLIETQGLESGSEKLSSELDKLFGSTEYLSNGFFDAAGNMKPMEEVTAMLRDSMGGLTAEQKIAYAETLVGRDNMSALTAIVGSTAEEFDALGAAIEGTSAADVAATRLDNMQGSIEGMFGAIETLSINIGTKLIPVLTDIINNISNAVTWFSSLDEGMQNGIIATVGIGGAMLLFAGILIKTISGIQSAIAVVKALGIAEFASSVATKAKAAAQLILTAAMNAGKFAMMAYRGAVAAVTTAIWLSQPANAAAAASLVAQRVAMVATTIAQTAMRAAMVVATAAQWAFNAALTANPIGIVIAAIAALVAGLVWFFTQTELGQQIWQGFVDFIVMCWEGLVAAAQVTWEAVLTAVQAVVDWFMAYVQPTIQAVIDFIIAVFNGFMNVVKTVWTAIQTAVNAVVAWFMAHVYPTIQKFVEFITKLFNFLRDATALVWAAISKVVSETVGKMIAWVVQKFNEFKLGMAILWTAVKTVFTNAWNAIVAFVKPIVDGLVSFITNTWNTAKNTWDGIWSTIKAAMNTIWNGIKAVVEPIVTGIVGFITNTWNGITGTVRGIFTNVQNAIKEPIKNAMDFMGTIKSTIMGFFSGAGSWLMNAGSQIIGGFLNGLQSMLGEVGNFFSDLTNMIPEIKGPPEKDKVLLTDNGKLIMQSLYNGLDSEIGNVTGLLNGLNATIPATIQQDINANVGLGSTMRREQEPQIVLNLTYQAAPGDGTRSKEDVMAMLGHATELVRKELV